MFNFPKFVTSDLENLERMYKIYGKYNLFSSKSRNDIFCSKAEVYYNEIQGLPINFIFFIYFKKSLK